MHRINSFLDKLEEHGLYTVYLSLLHTFPVFETDSAAKYLDLHYTYSVASPPKTRSTSTGTSQKHEKCSSLLPILAVHYLQGMLLTLRKIIRTREFLIYTAWDVTCKTNHKSKRTGSVWDRMLSSHRTDNARQLLQELLRLLC